MTKTVIVAISKDGLKTALKLAKEFKEQTDIFIAERLSQQVFEDKNVIPKGFSIEIMDGGFIPSAERIFKNYDKIILLMACGVAVRGIGPLAVDKRVDPAVVVADERGKFVISFLSGHLGGANRIAREVAAITGGTAVITTASDLKGFIAVDTLSEKANWTIMDIHSAGKVTAELVDGESTGILIDKEALEILPDDTAEEILAGGYTISEVDSKDSIQGLKALVYVGWEKNEDFEYFKGEKTWLIPRDLILGLGCRKETSKDSLIKAYNNALKKAGVRQERVRAIATIGIKAEDQEIRDFAKEEGLKIIIIPENEITNVEYLFPASDFVKQTVGVSAVAEPSAYIATGEGTKILEKQAENGITMAIYRMKI